MATMARLLCAVLLLAALAACVPNGGESEGLHSFLGGE